MTHTMIHGISAYHICALEGLGPGALGGGMVVADSSFERKAGESHSTFGCHTFRKPIRQAIEISDAPMSTIHGLMKFEIRNCGMANETPVTRIAGQTSFMPFQPAKPHTTPNRTTTSTN